MAMESARWQQIQSVFEEALSHDAPDSMTWLESTYAGDHELIARVKAMLQADIGTATLLDRGLPELAYQTIGVSLDADFTRQFGPYKLKRILGEGGMGVVWLAERLDAGNMVAIKFLPHAAISAVRRERFAHEIKTLARLKHENIARMYDAGALADGTPWFVMEYVEGVSLGEYWRQNARPINEQLKQFRCVCQAVQYAHAQEVIHRDLKPSNVMVEKNGTPRLLDFGIAKELRQDEQSPGSATRLGLRFVSPVYAAPEWVRDGVAGIYTDVYSLGVMLYEMLTGELPTADHPPKPSAAAASRIPKASRNDLDVLCLKAMHPEAGKRYSSVEALMRDIDHFLNHEPLEARPDSNGYRVGKFMQRNRNAVIAAAAAFVVIATLIVGFTVRLAHERNAALAEAIRRQRIQKFMLTLFRGEDKDAGPAEGLKVVALIDRGALDARGLNSEPEVQAELYQTLGTMYQKLSKFDRANEMLQLAVNGQRSPVNRDYAALADSLLALAELRSDQGRLQEAMQLAHESMTLTQEHEPGNHELRARSNLLLGKLLIAAGRNGEALAALNALASTQSTENPRPPELAQTLRALAEANLYLGHYQAADSLDQQALTMDRETFGEKSPQVSDDLSDLSQMLELRGNYPEAERYERQAVQTSQDWYGKDHPDTAGKMTHLASTLIYEDKYDEAEALLKQSVTVQEKVYGPLSTHVAYVLNLLGSVANKRSNLKAAEADDQRVIEIYRSAYGDADYRVAVGMANLASVYFKEKNYTLAEAMFRDTIQRNTGALSADNLNTGVVEIKLGRTLLKEKRYREAEPHSRAGYEVMLKQTSPQTSFVKGAREDLIEIYGHLGKPEEAKKLRELVGKK